jgi:hypothetical protein
VNVPRDQASYNAAINAHPRVAGLNQTLASFQQLNAEARERAAAGQRSPAALGIQTDPRAGLGLRALLAQGQHPGQAIPRGEVAPADVKTVRYAKEPEGLKPASGLRPDQAAAQVALKNPGLEVTPTGGLRAGSALRESLMARGLIEDQGARDARVAANRAGYQSRIAKSLGDRKEAVQTAAIQRNEDREGRMRTPFQNAMLAARDARNDAMGLERDRMSAQERIAQAEQQGLNTRSTNEVGGRKDVATIAAGAQEKAAQIQADQMAATQKYQADLEAGRLKEARQSRERIAQLETEKQKLQNEGALALGQVNATAKQQENLLAGLPGLKKAGYTDQQIGGIVDNMAPSTMRGDGKSPATAAGTGQGQGPPSLKNILGNGASLPVPAAASKYFPDTQQWNAFVALEPQARKQALMGIPDEAERSKILQAAAGGDETANDYLPGGFGPSEFVKAFTGYENFNRFKDPAERKRRHYVPVIPGPIGPAQRLLGW